METTELAALYADDWLVVVAKPSGMLVHPGWARDGVTAVTAARALLGRAVHPVHRLDRGTSGTLLFALDPATTRALHDAFEAGRIEKHYLALVRGVPPAEAIVDHPIPRREDGPRVPAVTAIRRIAQIGRYALVEARPRTGRLHQVRRHLKHLSCPVIGDANYGKGEHNRLLRERVGLGRLALHARELAFDHPATGVRVVVRAPLPRDLAGPLAAIGFEVASL